MQCTQDWQQQRLAEALHVNVDADAGAMLYVPAVCWTNVRALEEDAGRSRTHGTAICFEADNEKSWLKLLLADLIWEKNTVVWHKKYGW